MNSVFLKLEGCCHLTAYSRLGYYNCYTIVRTLCVSPFGTCDFWEICGRSVGDFLGDFGRFWEILGDFQLGIFNYLFYGERSEPL